MPCFRVDVQYVRTKSFFVDAESKEEVENFLDDNDDWQPSDVEGLVDRDESVEDGFEVAEPEGTITPLFRILNGALEEIG